MKIQMSYYIKGTSDFGHDSWDLKIGEIDIPGEILDNITINPRVLKELWFNKAQHLYFYYNSSCLYVQYYEYLPDEHEQGKFMYVIMKERYVVLIHPEPMKIKDIIALCEIPIVFDPVINEWKIDAQSFSSNWKNRL